MPTPNVVQLVSHKHWKHKICRSRFLSIEPFAPHRTGYGWEGYADQRTVLENLSNQGISPDIAIAYKPLDHRGFANLSAVKILQYNEIKTARFEEEVKKASPTIVVFHHLNDYAERKPFVKQQGAKPVYIPHCADSSIFCSYGEPKQ